MGAVILVFMNLYAGGHILREISAREQMLDGVRKISDEDFTYKIPTENLNRINAEIADNMNRIGDNRKKAVQESVRNERRKTDRRQCLPRLKDTPHIHHQLHRPSEAGGDTKSQDRGVCGCAGQEDRASEDPNGDLVEVSKINSGNFHIQPEQIDFREFQQQVQGKFFEQLRSRGLQTVNSMPEEHVISAPTAGLCGESWITCTAILSNTPFREAGYMRT